jgi:capsular exopolysaccharide synthesis family protein
MSKFFKALEHAEREREDARGATTAAPAAPAEAPEAPTPAPEAPPKVTPPTPRPVRVRPPAPQPVEAPAEPELPVAEPAPPRVTIRELTTPAFGAPLVREASASPAHQRAFRSLLPPVADGERSDLDDHLVSLLEPASPAAEQYRALRLHVETLHRERDLRLVAMSSPARGDGKTLSALNLAGALAQAPDARVVLIEVDMRNPGVAEYLGLPGRRGLSSYLLDTSVGADTAIERPDGIGFSLVVAGPVPSMPYELLKSPRLTALLAEVRERFDYVVIDTPPVLPYPDTGILRELVDGFILVVRANRTPREMVREAITTLGERRVLGVVFNDDERTAIDQAADGGWRSRFARPVGGLRG